MSESLEEIIKAHYPEFVGVHPACLAVPDMSGEDFDALVKDVTDNGLLEPIVRTPDNFLLDGRNRLLACYHGSVEIHTKTTTVEPWLYSAAANIHRRHLTVGQKAMFGASMREHFDAEAKERIVEGGRNGGKGAGNVTLGLGEQARDAAGKAAGVSGSSIDKARTIREHRPDLAKQVESGSLPLEQAHKEAQKVKKTKVAPAEPKKPAASQETAQVVTVEGKVYEVAKPKRVVFNSTNDSVDWASWTWNPVTGCEHGCDFCYAREIAHNERMAPYYPAQFRPAYHEYRLDAPTNTSYPATLKEERDGRVFVCSMADLFGKWVPETWIKSVFDACLKAPEWEYMFLTKWPARYAKMPLLEGAWYGSSVTKQADVSRVERAMKDFECGSALKWVSMEPMLGPVQFADLSWCDLMVIGSQTSTTQPDKGYVAAKPAHFDWVFDVVQQCRESGVPYYLKANLGLEAPGMVLPKMSPRSK